MNSFLRFTRNYRNIVNGNKVVIVNRDTGMWMRISKECFDILDEAIQALNSHARKNQMKISTNPQKTSVLAFNLQIVPG